MMKQQLNFSPRITHLAWGHIEIEGQQHFKDVKCFPGGVRAWDWNETGTRHTPGIQPTDIKELLEQGAQIIVLSKGFYGRLHICPETLQLLEKTGITVYTRLTPEAVTLYNELIETESVGALFHSTC